MFKKLKGFLLSVRKIAKISEKVSGMIVVAIDAIIDGPAYGTA